METESLNKIKEKIVRAIECKNYQNLHVLLGELINEVMHNSDVTERIDYASLFINDLLNLNNEFVDDAIGTSFFIDLWEEYKNDEKMICFIESKLSKKGYLLFRENIEKWKDFENPDHINK